MSGPSAELLAWAKEQLMFPVDMDYETASARLAEAVHAREQAARFDEAKWWEHRHGDRSDASYGEIAERVRALAQPAAEPGKCPTCNSPAPHLHPAMQSEGEVQPCRDRFHTAEPPREHVHTPASAWGPGCCSCGWKCNQFHGNVAECERQSKEHVAKEKL